MIENSMKIVQEKYIGDLTGDCLLINTDELRETYKYIGIWYARDGSEDTSITTEIYFASEDKQRPENFNIEIKENSFKQFNRKELPIDEKKIWISTRIDNGKYCNLKLSPVKEGKFYINYKIVHNKGVSFDIVGNGTIKAGSGHYYGIFCEDNSGQIDFKDLVMFFVALKEIPPEDWKIDHYSFGIDGLPVFAQPFRFNDNGKYSNWLGQNPLK